MIFYMSIAITSLTSSTELNISTREWTVSLKYLVAKSRSLVNVDGRLLNSFSDMALLGGPPKGPYIDKVITWSIFNLLLSPHLEAKYMFLLSSFQLLLFFTGLDSKIWLPCWCQDKLLICYSTFSIWNMAISKQHQLFTQYFVFKLRVTMHFI